MHLLQTVLLVQNRFVTNNQLTTGPHLLHTRLGAQDIVPHLLKSGSTKPGTLEYTPPSHQNALNPWLSTANPLSLDRHGNKLRSSPPPSLISFCCFHHNLSLERARSSIISHTPASSAAISSINWAAHFQFSTLLGPKLGQMSPGSINRAYRERLYGADWHPYSLARFDVYIQELSTTLTARL